EAPVETPSEEESKPLEEAPAAEEPDVLSPKIKQEDPSETEINHEAPALENNETPEEVEQGQETQEEIQVIEETPLEEPFISPVAFTVAGALMGPVMGASFRMAMAARSMPSTLTTLTGVGDDPNIHLKKSAVYNEDTHTVDLTLEAFVTGNISTNIKKIPADIIMVLDQSGSMRDGMNGGNASTGNRKIDILKNVLNSFVDDVIEDATEPGKPVNHRISMVGFAEGWSYGYENTEILTTEGNNPYTYSSNVPNSIYKNSLVSVRTTAGQNIIDDAISDLGANGATRTDLGIHMAKKVLDQHPVDAVQDPDGRQRIVIVFTDGVPTSESTFDNGVANDAIDYANDLKNLYGATVYTIGIYNGANPLDTSTNTNKFMNYVSSNYKNATSLNTNANTRTGTGYFLSASNASELDEIFTEISKQIENPGNTSLTSASVLKDLLTPQLHFPDSFQAGTDVDIKVYNYTGNGTDYLSPTPWSELNPRPGGITATVNKTTKELQITGFDYTTNFVALGTSGPRGKKIVVKFTVDVNEDFIGGNKVVTNKPSSGIYAPDSSFVEAFPIPTVDIPLRYEADPVDKGIYISQSIPANELISGNGLSYKINGVSYTVDGIIMPMRTSSTLCMIWMG
ncbi:vWA domain-containing protein, partial [Proteiniclasticum sp.]|uniref:vWA domain-containing protein n=1 Tax=Proteiniclasticum sp. TaxID=2053595 RepID=UPI002898A14A